MSEKKHNKPIKKRKNRRKIDDTYRVGGLGLGLEGKGENNNKI